METTCRLCGKRINTEVDAINAGCACCGEPVYICEQCGDKASVDDEFYNVLCERCSNER